MGCHRRRAGCKHALAFVGLIVLLLAACDGDGRRQASSTTGSPSTATTGAVPTTTTMTAPTATSAGPATAAPTTTPPTTTTAAAGVPATLLTRGGDDRRVVALTFDAGNDAGHVEAILDTLRAAGIHASFGLTGQWVEQNPDATRRVVSEGHLVMNHTQNHQSFTGASTGGSGLGAGERRSELEQADAVVTRVTGVGTRPWFRPPYGDTDPSVQRDVGALGYSYEVLWTLDSLGWRGLASDAITARCLDGAQPGAIYLFHVGTASADYAALPTIIDGLRSGGYGFVTVAQLVGAS